MIKQSREQSREQTEQTLIERLRIRANIRRNSNDRKSIQEGEDRLANLLDDAANKIERLEMRVKELEIDQCDGCEGASRWGGDQS